MSIFKNKHGIDPPAPVQTLRPLVVIVDGRQGLRVRLEAPQGHFSATTNAGGVANFPSVPVTMTTANLFIDDPSSEFYGRVIDIPNDGQAHQLIVGSYPAPLVTPFQVQLPPLVSMRLFPGESGRLHVDGKYIFDDLNRPWRCRGVSLFLLPMRFFAGQDISADFEWMTKRGFNEARVFGSVNWGEDLAPGWLRPWDRPDFDAKWHAFITLAGSYGIRIKLTVHTYAFDLTEMRTVLQRMYDIAQTHWNCRIQVANEAENNGIDVVAVSQGIDRHGVMSSYGNDPERHCDGQPDADAWGACMRREVPCQDTGSSHDLRRDIQSARIAKDAWEFQQLFGIAWEWEEPPGTIEFGDPIMIGPDSDGFWYHKGGGGVRTTNRDVIYGGAIVSCFFVSGYTYHPECGAREGRAPRLDEVTQDGVAKMLGAIYQWLPTDLPLGQYTRPGLNGFAVKWTDGDTDSKVGHAYGVITGNVQHVVVPMPSASWKGFDPVPGWKLDAVGPLPYLARFVRT